MHPQVRKEYRNLRKGQSIFALKINNKITCSPFEEWGQFPPQSLIALIFSHIKMKQPYKLHLVYLNH